MAINTHGTLVEYEDPDNVGNFVNVNCPGDITIPGPTNNYTDDFRHCDDGSPRKFPGSKNYSENTVSVRYDGSQASHQFLRDLALGPVQQTPLVMRYTLPVNAGGNIETFTIPSFVSFAELAAPVEGIADMGFVFTPAGGANAITHSEVAA